MLLRRDADISCGEIIYKDMHMYKDWQWSWSQTEYTSDQRGRTQNSQKMEEDSDAPRAGLLIDWVAVGVWQPI